MQRVSILNLVMFFRSFSTQLYFYNVRKYPKFQQNMETYLLVRVLDSMSNIIVLC